MVWVALIAAQPWITCKTATHRPRFSDDRFRVASGAGGELVITEHGRSDPKVWPSKYPGPKASMGATFERRRSVVTVWGYARVSTIEQDPAAQVAALLAAGVDEDRIVVDKASGSRADRPGLARILDAAEAGDVITVWRLDRMGRSLSHLVQLVEELGRRDVHLRSLTESIDTQTSTGRLILHIFGAIAEFERSLVRERTELALAQARAKGRQLGRPSAVSVHQWRLAHQMEAAGESHRVIASTTGLSRSVVGRVLRGEIASVTARFAGAPLDDGGLPLYAAAGERDEPASPVS